MEMLAPVALAAAVVSLQVGDTGGTATTPAVGDSRASCHAALVGLCNADAARASSPFAQETCRVCCGHQQRQLRLANCSHAETEAYCDSMVPDMMIAAYKTSSCGSPFDCVTTHTVPVPNPGPGEALIRVAGSSVNPCDVDYVEGVFAGCSGGGGTLGMDVAGTVTKIGRGDCRLKVGDRVWADLGGVTGDTGGMAEYAVVRCAQAGIAPRAINLTAAGTIPLAGLTSVEALQAMGAPWPQPNLTMVVTSGTGGTGYIGVQLAKAVSHCIRSGAEKVIGG